MCPSLNCGAGVGERGESTGLGQLVFTVQHTGGVCLGSGASLAFFTLRPPQPLDQGQFPTSFLLLGLPPFSFSPPRQLKAINKPEMTNVTCLKSRSFGGRDLKVGKQFAAWQMGSPISKCAMVQVVEEESDSFRMLRD